METSKGVTQAGRFYIDCEFDGHGGELLSMALVRENGRGIYLCVADEPDLLDPWVKENVWPLVHLRLPVGRTVAFIEDWGSLIRSFIGPYGTPVIVADSPVDIWRFCQIISTDSDGQWQSTDWKGMAFEVHNVDCYPTDLPGAVQHNAWWDAMALRHRLAHTEVGRLREALRPFSEALGNIADTDRDRWPDNETIEHSGAAEEITWGDLRIARTALNRADNAEGGLDLLDEGGRK